MINLNYDFLNDSLNQIVIIKGLETKEGEVKVPAWQRNREKYLYTGDIEDQNLRQIMNNEVIIEFDFIKEGDHREEALKYIERIKKALIKEDKNFYITDHDGKSPHVRFQIKGLEGYDFNYIKSYKEKIVAQILKTIKFSSINLTVDNSLLNSEFKLISLEERPHWKQKYEGAIEKIIFKHDSKEHFIVKEEQIKKIIDEHNKSIQQIDKSILNKIIPISSVNQEILFEWWNKYYTEGNRNSVLLAYGGICHRCNIEFDDCIKLLEILLSNVRLTHWLNRCKNELQYTFNRKKEDVAVHFYLKEAFGEVLSNKAYYQLKDAFGLNEALIKAGESKISKDVYQFLIDNKRHKATELIVKEFLDQNIIYTTRDDENTRCWIYRDGIYVPQGKTYVKEFVRFVLGDIYTTQINNLIMDKIEADTFIEEKELFKVKDCWLVCMQNGVYNLKTKEFTDYSPDYFFFNKISVKFDLHADCPNIKKFFKSILDKKEEIITMYELFGHCLLKDYKIEKMFLLTGTGRNGKGKTVELLKRFLGIENCQAISMKDLTNDPFIISELMHRLVNIGGDINNEKIRDTAILKTLRGRDNITARRKNISPITFTNYAQLVFACNEVPPIEDNSDGFWNSWIYIEFNKKFRTQKEIDSFPLEERNQYTLIDTEIIDKISTEEELSGLFNISITALHNLLNNKGYSDRKSMFEIQKKWNRASNSCIAFIDECCELGESSLTKEEFREYYNKYCVKYNLRPKNDKDIRDTIQKSGCWETQNREEVLGIESRVRRWQNISFKIN